MFHSIRSLMNAFALCIFSLAFIFSFKLFAQTSENPASYVIKKGDTLSGIAVQTGIGYSRTDEIAAANNIDNMDLIFPGQLIQLDDFITAQTPPEAESIQIEQSDKAPDSSNEQAVSPETETRQKEPETDATVSITDEAFDQDTDKQTTETPLITDKQADKSRWKFNPDFSAGLALGQSFLDVEAENFEVSNQNINLDIDDSSLNAELFIIMSLNKHFGMELALHHLGVFEFSGTLGDPAQVGTSQGEHTVQAISLSAHYKKHFQNFNAQASAGIMQARHETSGNIDLIGTPMESIDDSENSSNLFIALEANRKIYKNWSLGPRLTWINTGDPIQSISIRLFRPIE